MPLKMQVTFILKTSEIPQRQSKPLKKLIERFPGNKYETEVRYNLYGLYSAMNKPDKAAIHKNYIIEKYPESDYAMLIKDPEFFKNRLRVQNVEAKVFYDRLFQLFEAGNCQAVVDSVNKVKGLYLYTRFYPKMEYLRIICIGKDTSKTVFISMLTEFVKKYKSNEVVSHAQNLLDYLEDNDTISKKESKKESRLIVSPYSYKPDAVHYFIMPFASSDLKTIKNGFSNYNAEFHELDELNIATILFSNDKQLLIVKEFPSKEDAIKYLKEVNSDEGFKKKVNIKASDMLVISAQNCSILLNLKDISQYKEFFRLNYKF